MRINKVTLRFLAIATVCVLVAAPIANLITKTDQPFRPSKQVIDSSSLVNYYQQNLNWNSCYGGFDCASYKVPIDYENLDLGEFDIAVMRHSTPNAIGNLVVNPGGPGGSGINYAYSYADEFTKAITTNFNIVGFDPRGVGRSAPITCLSNSETDQIYASSSYPETEAELATMQADSADFARKCAADNKYLSFYGTVNAARDMDILRNLLGDKQLNFLGKSYGTYLGTLYAQLFPKQVGKFILDGAVDPTLSAADQTLQQAMGFDLAFKDFANDCLVQSSCALNSDFNNQIQNKMSELRKNPIMVGNRKLTESLAMYGIGFGLYDKEFGWPELRTALGNLFNGDGKALLDMSDKYTGRDANGSYATNEAESLTVIACDDFPTTSSDPKLIDKAAPIFGKYVMYSGMECNYLPKSKYVAITKPIVLDNATLVIGTTNDPATPYQWATKLSMLLINSKLISLNSDGHTGFDRGNQCVDQAVEKYLISGVIPAQDLACSA